MKRPGLRGHVPLALAPCTLLLEFSYEGLEPSKEVVRTARGSVASHASSTMSSNHTSACWSTRSMALTCWSGGYFYRLRNDLILKRSSALTFSMNCYSIVVKHLSISASSFAMITSKSSFISSCADGLPARAS